MSLFKRQRGQKEYYYFKRDKGKQIYIGPEDNIRVESVSQALDYIQTRIDHYSDVARRLLALLPEEERRRIFEVSQIKRLQGIIETGRTDTIRTILRREDEIYLTILKALSEGAQTSLEIESRTGFDLGKIEKALDAVYADGFVIPTVGSPERRHWTYKITELGKKFLERHEATPRTTDEKSSTARSEDDSPLSH